MPDTPNLGTSPEGEEVELPSDEFPEGQLHASQASDPLPGAPA